RMQALIEHSRMFLELRQVMRQLREKGKVSEIDENPHVGLHFSSVIPRSIVFAPSLDRIHFTRTLAQMESQNMDEA
ncbi:MAG: hypothetical protein OK457_07650, partial [Thaumarchaeota archaeon]|nr:hypothetical protein [Nitrososphaerota archaeon]